MARTLVALVGSELLLVLSPAAPALATDCYVDNVSGDDSQSGLTASQAVKTQAKIGSTCTVVRFKRGNVYNEQLGIVGGVSTYTNYGNASDPLPKFIVPRTRSSGPVIQGLGKGHLTFDGLYFSGATGDGTMAGLKGISATTGDTAAGLLGGACVVLGFGSELTNSEVTDCDVGVLLADEGAKVTSSYLHDMSLSAGELGKADSYLFGAGIGILINGNINSNGVGNSEPHQIRHNVIVNCKGTAPRIDAGIDCYGGAIEVIAPSGGEVWTEVFGNYAYGNCGFTRIGTFSGSVDKGKGSYSGWYGVNIIVDSGWMASLQVDRTDLFVRSTNETFVQHRGSTSAGTLTAVYAAAPLDGSLVTLPPNAVSLTQDLVVMDGVADFNPMADCNLDQDSNLFIDMSKQDPGFVNKNGKTAADYDLVSTSLAINKGGETDSMSQDFFGRSVPDTTSWTCDVGACEYGSSGKLPAFFPGAAAWIGTVGTGGQGGVGGTGGAGGSGSTSGAVAAQGGGGGAFPLDAPLAGTEPDSGSGGNAAPSAGATGTGGAGGTICPGTAAVGGTGGASPGAPVAASEVAVWQQFHPSLAPLARTRFAMAYHPGTQKTYVFGGIDPQYNLDPQRYSPYSDLWAWDGKAWAQVTGDMKPPARVGSTMAYDPTRNSLILFGGGAGLSTDDWTRYDTLFDDTWEWTESQGWTELRPASKPLVGTGPGPSGGVVMFTDTTRSKLLLDAGWSMSTSPDDPRFRYYLWEWDGVAMTWSKRAPVADSSELAWIGLLAYDEGRQKLFFVEPQYANSPSFFTEWDPVTAGFTKDITQVRLSSAALTNPLAAAYDSIRRRMVVLTEWPTDTWELDTQGLTWYHRALSRSLGEVFAATMVFDSARGVMVAFAESETTSNTVINVLAEFKVSQLGHGEGCTASTAASCASGLCVEGVCCDVAACTGACMSCSVPGSEGICTKAKAGAEVPGSCGSGLACDGAGACLAANGRTCATSRECASGFCVDGVCCESACAVKCTACNLAGQAGRCRPYQEGADPESECGDGTGVCKSFCDGVGGCTYPANEVICGSCMTCDGYGACTSYDNNCSYLGGNHPSGTGGAGGKADAGADGAGGRPDTGGAGGTSATGGGGSKADASAGGAGGASGGRDAAAEADASIPKLGHSGCSCAVSGNSSAMPSLALLALLGLLLCAGRSSNKCRPPNLCRSPNLGGPYFVAQVQPRRRPTEPDQFLKALQLMGKVAVCHWRLSMDRYRASPCLFTRAAFKLPILAISCKNLNDRFPDTTGFSHAQKPGSKCLWARHLG